nr:ATP-binding protein [Aetokthonos hydrillicola CCALA 1050]
MVSFAAVVCASAITLFPTGSKAASSSSKKIDKSEHFGEPTPQDNQQSSVQNIPGAFRLYRKNELNRIVASLLASGSILVAGEEGSGKTVLAQSVVEKLQDDGFLVADVQPATSKQM